MGTVGSAFTQAGTLLARLLPLFVLFRGEDFLHLLVEVRAEGLRFFAALFRCGVAQPAHFFDLRFQRRFDLQFLGVGELEFFGHSGCSFFDRFTALAGRAGRTFALRIFLLRVQGWTECKCRNRQCGDQTEFVNLHKLSPSFLFSFVGHTFAVRRYNF